MKLKQKKNENAITLIALVVTIVVLLILAGVSISMLTGENGIITQAQEAKLETRGGEVEEKVNAWKNEYKLNKYSKIEVKSESNFIKDLKEQKLVFDDEMDEENKIIKIGSREIYYGLEENDPTTLKFLVNSGENGIVVLPIDIDDCNASGYQVDWGDGTTGIDDTVIASNVTKLASKRLYLASYNPNGIPHTYTETNKEYVVTITGRCESISIFYSNVTKEKIIEVLQWGETGLQSVKLGYCENLRKIAAPSENSFRNITSFESAFEWCTSLNQIPENLFENCDNTTNFRATFLGCTSLTQIPENLFENCLNVTNFSSTFGSCISLAGNAPELWLRGTNAEENFYKGYPDGEYCFFDCTGLSNYKIIPDYWKKIPK